MFTRRSLILASLYLAAHRAVKAAPAALPESSLMQPAELAKILRDGRSAPVVICVGFPVLYRQKHIPGSLFAGPASKPEGIAALQNAVASKQKDQSIVLYCGCCPMVQCPNVRPAYQALTNLGYRNLRVLNLPTNFHTDWAQAGYPTESSLSR